MIPPPYRHSISSSVMPLDLNQDQNHDLSSPNSSSSSSSSFSSLSPSYPTLFNSQDQVQKPSYYCQTNHLPHDQEVEKINIPSSGSWNSSTAENHENYKTKHKLTIRWKKEQISDEMNNNQEADQDGTSVKWMSSKMRIMKKMMVSDQTGSSNLTSNSKQIKFEDQKQPLSPQGTDNSSSNNYSTIRVCSDCNTTKTPLWRSGPRGPKSLCNACGIRQRKARRALAAAAASANGTTIADQTASVKRKKLQKKKENKSKIEFDCSTVHMKKKHKLEAKPPSHQSRKEFITFEDLKLSLSENLGVQQVFPQDEREAAILLMALSYGLVHG
ncbi:GATA type zinc finger transcription factor family protein [Medicago truncatula]|uniref:GATA type zinc finger transcription factor family protein n=2 Tax=Medicago truncatula TaxID=3880 RepID=A0A072URU2_MEDTR|nr:GATA type zinc finger transcription factor family protein [Medicago truncatula]